jgi:hypothetical protein
MASEDEVLLLVCLAGSKMFLVMFHFRLLLLGWRAENLGLSGPWLIRDAH